MIFDPDIILKKKSINFSDEWNNSKKYINISTINNSFPRFSFNYGSIHPIYETINNLRTAYLKLGFSEIMNPLIVDEKDIKKQFGGEALAVLDRCYYLAGLPRPNIGIEDIKIKKIAEIINITEHDKIMKIIEQIRSIFHLYKKGKIEGDDLVYELSNKLNVEDVKIIKMLEEVFPEFKELKPVGYTKTLRSHMTSGWFITLSNLLKIKEPPYYLFSIDRCFRREQEEDPSRLMTYFSASCVILDENVTIDYGKAVAEGILSQFGFEKFVFKEDSKKSKYYTPGTQIEVYAYHPLLKNSNTKYNDGWIEIATFGIYSPCALSEYHINYPVMNFGLGVERLAMILYNSTDVRAITYPQFQHNQWIITDVELCKQIKLINTPHTKKGFEIANSLINTAKKYYQEKSPCEFIAWKGNINNKNILISIIETENNTKLCGPAIFNEIVVYDGNIYGVDNNEKYSYLFENDASRTNIKYIESISYKVASIIEEYEQNNKELNLEIKFKIAKSLSDVNLKISDIYRKYITSNNKKIDIRGPLFTTFKIIEIN